MDYFRKQNSKTIAVFLIGLTLIALIGYVDAFTSVLSFDGFYLLVIFTVIWFVGAGCGMICVLEAVLSAAVADYYSEMEQVLNTAYFWNWATDLVIFSAFCALVGFIRHKLSSESQ
jgi:hypothetical protein